MQPDRSPKAAAFDGKVRSLREAMKEQKLSALLFYSTGQLSMLEVNPVLWISGVLPMGRHTGVFLTAAGDATMLITLPWDEGRARERSWIEDVKVTDRFAEAVNKLAVEKRIGGDIGLVGWAFMPAATAPSSRWIRVPFTAWQSGVIGGDTILRQIYTVITGSGSDSLWRPGVLLDREYNGETIEVFYPLTIVSDSQKVGTGSIAGTYDDNIPWDPVEGPRVRGFLWVNGGTYSVKNAVWKVYIADLDHDGVPAPPGTVVRFERFKFVRNGDEKVFSPASVRTTDAAAARRAVGEVNVFPNPYYGFNTAEVDRLSHFITFSHLPRHAVIRIFNLGGDLIRTIQKQDETQFATWDLNNHNGLPVGGGLYLAHIEMKDASGLDLGSKTLKLMVVPEKQSIQLR